MSITSLLVPAILFFALGMFAQVIKSDLKFPPDMHKMIVIYLLIGIGLHGGKASDSGVYGRCSARRGSGFSVWHWLAHCRIYYFAGRSERSIRSMPRQFRRTTAR